MEELREAPLGLGDVTECCHWLHVCQLTLMCLMHTLLAGYSAPGDECVSTDRMCVFAEHVRTYVCVGGRRSNLKLVLQHKGSCAS